MKRIIASAAAVAVLAGVTGFTAKAWGQAPQASSSLPQKVGLIDMAEVFKSYKKFETLRKDLEGEIAQSNQRTPHQDQIHRAKNSHRKEVSPNLAGSIGR